MKFLVISHVTHTFYDGKYWAYGPYIREMNIWTKNIDELLIIAPLNNKTITAIDFPYSFSKIEFRKVPSFDLIGFKHILLSFITVPWIIIKLVSAMREADHIHLRCPGNMGLLGAIVQVFFPHKKKTAKYAGNWDWNSVQPWTYRFQQRIIRNTFLSRNMQVLVYGQWQETKNIKPFFTASYSEKEITQTIPRRIYGNQPINLIFIGGLHDGKRPLLSLEVVKKLIEEQIPCTMHFYGDGPQKSMMGEYRFINQLQNTVFFHGNVSPKEVKLALQKSHFLVFFSKSEGWPKAVAEAMFWGCLPLTSAVSCIPHMLGNGERGDIIEPEVNIIIEKIKYYLSNPFAYYTKCDCAMKWSREFTLEKFENEIIKLLN